MIELFPSCPIGTSFAPFSFMASRKPSPSAERSRHRPVLVREVVRWLDLSPGMTVVDGTVGAGGHSSAILPSISPSGRLIGLDRDPMMLAHAEKALAGGPIDLVHSSYADLRTALDQLKIEKVDRVLLDLGLSSDQLADESRGFSFLATGPLDLRFDVSKGVPASEIVTTSSVDELTRIFREYGEEPNADKVAQQIVAGRKRQPITTADRLAEIVAGVAPGGSRISGSHPATRVFQALRIAANRELEELLRMLDETLPQCLAPGGRAVIISFHSLEDRMVKEAFRDRERWAELTPKPIPPTPSEERMNPRARTAKLRAAALL